MDNHLLKALQDGMELRIPAQDVILPIDFIVIGAASTLVFLSDWWQKEDEIGVGVLVIDAVPRQVDVQKWTFDHQLGYTIELPTDGDQAKLLQDAQLRARYARPRYLSKLLTWSASEPEFDFRPWIEHITSLPVVLLDDLVADETRERSIGKILLRDGRGLVVDTLVIDERGHAATASEDGHLSRFAEEWMSIASGARPTMNEFIARIAEQQIYGDFSFDGAGVVSASGEVQEIALQFASA